MVKYSSPDEYFSQTHDWHEGLLALRKTLLDLGILKEELKWGGPIYTFEGRNVVGIGSFKSHFALWFFNGSFLSDPNRVLINAQEGTTKALRQMRFSSLTDINTEIINHYVLEAVDNEKKGVFHKADRSKPIIIPEELLQEFDKNELLKSKFSGLNKTLQREFTEYISTAKQEKTRLSRLEKIIPMILEGVGLHDKYR